MGRARPGEARPADADAVFQRLMVRQHEIEPPLAGVDDDRARRLGAVERDGLARDRLGDRLQLGIERIGEGRRGRSAQQQARHCGGSNKDTAHQVPRLLTCPGGAWKVATPCTVASQVWRTEVDAQRFQTRLPPQIQHFALYCGEPATGPGAVGAAITQS